MRVTPDHEMGRTASDRWRWRSLSDAASEANQRRRQRENFTGTAGLGELQQIVFPRTGLKQRMSEAADGWRENKYDHAFIDPLAELWVEALAAGWSVPEIARVCKMDRSSAHNWRKHHVAHLENTQ